MIETITTHSDTFHCDEVMGCAIMKILYPNAKIIRTRDDSIIKNSEFVLDVGKVYDPSKNLFDHHQETFNDTFNEKYNVPMSSCGLIWKHYGKMIIELNDKFDLIKDHLNDIYEYMYKSFIFPIDCNDNGISNTYGNMIYNPIEISNIVSSYNSKNDKEQDGKFNEVMVICQSIFKNFLEKSITYTIEYYNNYDTFLESFNSRNPEYPYYIVINKEYNVRQYLKKFDPNQTIKFIIVKKNDNNYKLWTINKNNGEKFEILMKLISDKETTEDIIFIHKACFTGACKSLSSAINIIKQSYNKHVLHNTYRYKIYNYVYGLFYNKSS